MNTCAVCGKPGDTHHIIHKDEGGLEYPLNRVSLCEQHHRGMSGPHKDPETDLKYKRALHSALQNLFREDYYRKEEIRRKAELSNSLLRTLVKSLKRYKEGYRRIDIIDFLMSGHQLVEEEDYFDPMA